MRGRLVAPAVLAVAGLAWAATRGLPESLSYYRTPAEVAAEASAGERMRVGGLVEPGSVRRGDGVVRFVVTDGEVRLPVVQEGSVPPLFRGGIGAVVEGVYGPDGVFRADDVLVKHDEVYRAPEGSP